MCENSFSHIVDQFNEEYVKPAELSSVQKILQRFGAPSQVEVGRRYGDYVARFRGAYLYLDRIGFNQRPFEICRLKWTGDFDNWEFAIHKHSRNYYDPDEWFFPGAGEVDGTIMGAMRAGKMAYPD